NTSIQQLEQFFYWAFQTALAKSNENLEIAFMKRNGSTFPSQFINDFISSTNNDN
ncbi:unnamed protein product, partial [Rotaria sordida]